MNIFKKIYKFIKTSYRLKDIICSLPDDNTLEIKSSKSPSTQRIKTFIDAVDELLERSLNGDMKAKKIVDEYFYYRDSGRNISKDLMRFLELRILVTALNDGWYPTDFNVGYSPDIYISSLSFKNRELYHYANHNFLNLYNSI